MLIDSIMGTIDHIYCDNTFHVITEQNHRRNTIVRHASFPQKPVVKEYSEKATKIGPSSKFQLTLLSNVKPQVEDGPNFCGLLRTSEL